jgi:hypothetical protein
MTPTDIARGLTPAQRRALLWLPADGTWVAQERGKHQVSLWVMLRKDFGDPERAACWSAALVRNMATSAASLLLWRLTPLGVQVRAEVERMEGENGNAR